MQQIKENFPYQPTLEQEKVLKRLSDFLLLPKNDSVFLLKGYAGTGKTSLFSALVRTLEQMRQKCVLLAPTGRAAKVFASYADHPAYTIHKIIYRQQSMGADMGSFSLNDNLAKHTLFIVDEASMISNEGLAGSAFGSGYLLDDLIRFVYSGEGCRLMLMGDDRPSRSEDKSLLRCGLCFAGANQFLREMKNPADGQDEGILNALEIAQTDLRGLDLVVLSACQTALGDVVNGEGVFGLQRGFKKAGTRSILMSLWKVDDDITQLLMTEFYRAWTSSPKMTKTAALKAAQEKVKEKYPNPHDWAGFILLDALD